MAVGLPRRNPYGPPSFFGPELDNQYAQQGNGYMGFLDVAQSVPTNDAPGVGTDAPMQQHDGLFEPVGPQNAVAPVQAEQPPMESYPSEASIERRMKLAQALMGKQQEVNHPLQAIGNAVNQIAGAYLENKAYKDQERAEASRRNAWRDALSGGGDLRAVIDRMKKSTDPTVQEKALELEFQLLLNSGKKSNGKWQRIEKGDDYVYLDEDGNEVPGYGGPRFPNRGGGGGDGGSVQKNNMFLKPGDPLPKPGRFNPRTGPEYLDEDGQWKPIAPDMVEVTPSTVAPVSKQTLAKLDDEIVQTQAGITYFEDYAKTRGGARQGIAFAVDRIMGKAKTIVGNRNLTPEEFAALKSSPEFDALVGLFREPVLGPGVMTQQDREFLEEALGARPDALQNPQVMRAIVEQWVERRKHVLENLKKRREAYVSIGSSGTIPEPEAPKPREEAAPQRATPQYKQGQVVSWQDRNTGKSVNYQFLGGDPSDKRNWRKVK